MSKEIFVNAFKSLVYVEINMSDGMKFYEPICNTIDVALESSFSSKMDFMNESNLEDFYNIIMEHVFNYISNRVDLDKVAESCYDEVQKLI